MELLSGRQQQRCRLANSSLIRTRAVVMATGDGHQLDADQMVQRQQTMGRGVGGRMRLFSVVK